MSAVTLEVERSDDAPGVVRLTLDNPPVNATSIDDLRSIADVLTSLSESDKVVVISARGKGFSAGGDLKEMDQLPGHEGILQQCLESARACTAISQCPIPVIVAIHDYCLGVGIEVVGSADIAIANEEALFQWTEIDNGTIGGAAQGFRMLPPQALRYLMFTAEPVTARDLWSRGALTEVVPASELINRTDDIAAVIASKQPDLMRHLKSSMDTLEAVDIENAMRFEQGYIFQLNMEGTGSAARTAFLEGTRQGVKTDPLEPDA